ncbi:MAG: sugar ABC transporter ATP-binding protein [Firmicutes bacterium]|nr:sugar ABC transporter ATP-binding protein [Bacillota bacterium]
MAALLEMKGIRKEFPGVVALDGVDFSVVPGEIHALLGENGAGKSTLIKILAGLYTPDRGTVVFRGEQLNGLSPQQVQARGIAFIHQERAYIPYFTVGQTLFLGREPSRGAGLIDWPRLYRKASEELVRILGLEIDPHAPMESLTVSEKQLVDITKALITNPSLIVFDEPTGPLSEGEIERLFAVIKRLKSQGVTVVYISHRLDEVFQICDRATVLKDGKNVTTLEVKDATPDGIVRLMVGKELKEKFPKVVASIGDPILEVSNLCRGHVVRNVSFKLRRGEILGIYGLVGAGRTEMVRLVFGADKKDAGSIMVEGVPVIINSPREAIDQGIALVPEDRRGQGVIVEMSVRDNVTLPSLKGFSRAGFVASRRERAAVQNFVKQLNIKTPGIDHFVKYLSGGNQQKVVLSKWLCGSAKVVIFDQPTIGIDVGAKTEIYRLMGKLVSDGAGVILVSSEIPEVLGLSDRILVMYRGRITAELSREEATPDRLLFYAMGGGVADVQ